MTSPTRGEHLGSAITFAAPRLQERSGEQAAKPLAPGKWSPKQIMGHLVDSATRRHISWARRPMAEVERAVETLRNACMLEQE